jgi:hypothetical protein
MPSVCAALWLGFTSFGLPLIFAPHAQQDSVRRRDIPSADRPSQHLRHASHKSERWILDAPRTGWRPTNLVCRLWAYAEQRTYPDGASAEGVSALDAMLDASNRTGDQSREHR